MTSEQSRRLFENRIKVLRAIDMYELVDAGVIDAGDTNAWTAFTAHPYNWMIRADDDAAERLWSIIERRAPKASVL